MSALDLDQLATVKPRVKPGLLRAVPMEGVLPLGRKQKRALARSTARVNLLDGSIRSGKTFIMLIRWFTFINTAPTRGALLMVGKSRDSLFRNIFEPIENDPTLAVFQPFISYKQGAPTAMMFGRKVHVMGAGDARAENKVRGMTLCGAFVDELTTLDKEFFKQVLGRLSVPGAQLFATTNPDSPNHWLKLEYLDKIDQFPDWRTWHFTMDDNPGLTDEYKASLAREYSGLWYLRFILGLWVAAEGAIYQEWDASRHVIPDVEVPNIDRVLIAALDYGTTHRTRAYLLGQGTITVNRHTGLRMPAGALDGRLQPVLVVLSEFAPGVATVGQHAAMFRSWLATQPVESWRDPEWLAVDPAAAVFRQQLFDDGHTNVMRAHNAVLPGIQTISSLLANGQLLVAASCTHLIRGIPGYRWDSAATKKGRTQPIKEDDDEVDALRYAVYTSRRFWREDMPLAPANNEEAIEAE